MRGFVGLAMAALLSGAAFAQETPVPVQQNTTPQFTVPADAIGITSILTVDIDRLFGQSEFGARIAREYVQEGEALSIENRRIAEALREEELALAEARPNMDIDVFRAEADAFDEKAQAIRRAQDAKRENLEQTFAAGRDQFLESARPVLQQLMAERGAFAILDRRSVLLAVDAIDVTAEAIARINAEIGDGSSLQITPQGVTPSADP